ncbi:MAG: efflux RND transporter permease subunit [Gammaproteobacteria bacterium]|nr:efflux RND transporter permease subunit [Gammaproteobacteria bacterium]
MDNQEVKGLIGWFATNHVAANLLMFSIIGLGIFSLFVIKKETMPEFRFNVVNVRVAYLGAAPQEVEEGVLVKIEESLRPIQGIREIKSTAWEGMGQVSIEVEDGFDIADITSEVKLAVDGISTFPAETERPIISKMKFRRGALNVQISGDLDEMSMKELAEDIRDEITALPEVSYAEVWGARPFEISVEISEITLRQYGLTLDGVAQIIRRWSVDLPGGSIRSESGTIRLRTKGQAYTGAEFADIVLLTRPDGTRVQLGDIATIRDAFAEVESYAFFDGQRSFGINVTSSGNESEIDISAAVHRYVESRQASLPSGVKLTAWADSTYYLKSRLGMMLKNMALGAVIVFAILSIFLHMKIATWVIIGLPVAFLGAFMMLRVPGVDVTINSMSLFGFILVLGIVVDDAIIIAESAYTETEAKGYTLPNIVAGAQRVAVPATFGVLTTIMAFVPLLLVTGPMAAINGALGWVVVFCLLFSLVESKLILPSHLAVMRSSHGTKQGIADRVDRGLKRFIGRVYMPLLRVAIEYRYATLALFVSMMILTGGLVAGGLVRFVFFPEVDGDFVRADIELQEGAPESLIKNIVVQMNDSLMEVNEELKAEAGTSDDIVNHLFAFIKNGTSGRFQIELSKSENRTVSPKEVERRWRERVGEVAGIKEMRFSSGMHMGGGPPIALMLQGANYERVEKAGNELMDHLKTYSGVYEVESSANAGPEEIKLRIRPEAEALGITLVDLASQVRQAFYGAEAQRVQRGTQEVKVMVRYPRSERQSIGNLEHMWIRMPDGRELPFQAVADYELARGYDKIERLDGRRTVTITANVNLNVTEPMQVIRQISNEFLPELLSRYPGVRSGLAGSSMEERMSLQQLGYAFLAALIGIYALMAIPLKSYVQPLIIMSVIPFGIIGAVIGHMIIGIALNAISIIGIIALSGVVVNDSLIMVDFINKKMDAGASHAEAAIESGAARFRAILLTSLTTFFGLAPIVLERSMQAQMMIPMAVSMAFGILFATVITLILVPCLYNIVWDMRRAVGSEPHEAQARAG